MINPEKIKQLMKKKDNKILSIKNLWLNSRINERIDENDL